MADSEPVEIPEAFDPGAAQFLLVSLQVLLGLSCVAGALVSDWCLASLLWSFGISLLVAATVLLSCRPVAYHAAAALNGTIGAAILVGMVLYRQGEMDLGSGQARPAVSRVMYWSAVVALPFLAYCTATAATLYGRAKKRAEDLAAQPPAEADTEDIQAAPGWDESNPPGPGERRE